MHLIIIVVVITHEVTKKLESLRYNGRVWEKRKRKVLHTYSAYGARGFRGAHNGTFSG